MKFSREFAMPSADTFSIRPVRAFIDRYIKKDAISIDPFARNSSLATFTNDLSPKTSALFHMDAQAFCEYLSSKEIQVDLAFFDPPYSPRQISEMYKSIGLEVGMKETQNSALYRRIRDALNPLVKVEGVVLSFGWNSMGMGIGRGYELLEVLLVAHGGAHNDTICIAERKCA